MVGLSLLGLAAVGCSSSTTSAPGPSSQNAGPTTPLACADGFSVIGDNEGCTPVLPASACGAGQRAGIGLDACASVGVAEDACAADGFVADASGWGCDVVVAPAKCAVGTRAHFGTTTCDPISDCSAAFPPANATVFVSAAYSDAQVDATHFKLPSAALAAAPAGAVIAIESGTYADNLVPTKAATIVGRCASQVILTPGDASKSGFEVDGPGTWTVKNLTFKGFHASVGALAGKITLDGVDVEDSSWVGVLGANRGTTITVTNSVVRGTRAVASSPNAFGVVANTGGEVDLTDSVVEDNDYIQVGATGDSGVTLTRSLVHLGRTPTVGSISGQLGAGIYASNGSEVDATETAILDHRGESFSIQAEGALPSVGKLVRSVVRRTSYDPTQKVGRGVEVNGGSTLTVEDSTIGESAQAEIVVAGASTADISGTTTIGGFAHDPTSPGGDGMIVMSGGKATAKSLAVFAPRVGVEVRDDAKLEMDDAIVLGTALGPSANVDDDGLGFGVTVDPPATLTMNRVTIQGAHTAGLYVDGTATITEAIVTGTRPAEDGIAGRGMSFQNAANVTLARSLVTDNVESGVFVDKASFSVTDSTIAGTALDPNGSGIGFVVGASGMGTIATTTITGSASIGLALDGAGATVTQCVLSKNPIALQAQDGTTIMQTDAPPGDALTLAVSSDTRFIDNQTRVGSGVVILPPVLGAN